VVCGGGPRAGTAGINSRSSSEADYCESEIRLFSLILCKSGFHAEVQAFFSIYVVWM
jgi:hypothetical protein